MSNLKYFGNCDWGLALLHGYQTGDYGPLLEQKKAVEDRGYIFFQRIYVNAEQGLEYPATLFWRGHEWLSLEESVFPTTKWMFEKCKELDIKVLPVVSTFQPGYPPEYNEVRHKIPQWKLNLTWLNLIQRYKGIIIACQIDNEPLSGGDAYTIEEYTKRVKEEFRYINSLGKVAVATHFEGNGVWTDRHLAIGRGDDFPPLASTESLSENWLRPNVPGGQYVKFVEYAKGHPRLQLSGVNFGAPFIPTKGLKWGNSWYRTFLWDATANNFNKTGVTVLDALGDPVEEECVSQEAIVTLLERWRDRAERLFNRIENDPNANKPRLRGRISENMRCRDELMELAGLYDD